ncbi:hypothetical protein HanIR_Chr01g0043661 [Helianthus annuus]|nr:hypothetical protein HanIR_Chr01g0043661 [Helianthus annuus]
MPLLVKLSASSEAATTWFSLHKPLTIVLYVTVSGETSRSSIRFTISFAASTLPILHNADITVL